MTTMATTLTNDDNVPVQYTLTFPPWSRPPPTHTPTPFAQFIHQGIQYHTSESSTHATASHFTQQKLHVKLIDVENGPPTAAQASTATMSADHVVNKAGLAVVRLIDAWSIGKEGVEWNEPDGTSLADYSL